MPTKPRVNIIGNKYGFLTVMEEVDRYISPSGKPQRRFKCQCNCGNITYVNYYNLTRPKNPTVSCGCYAIKVRAENAKRSFTTHGCRKERLYGIWCGMRRRCEKDYDPEYASYGGRGISVCDEWQDYGRFREWALSHGYDPSAPRGDYTIERIDNDEDYTPINCKFVDIKSQANNKQNTLRYEWNGGMYSLTEIMNLSKTELSRICVYKRLRKGWSVDTAISVPKMKNQYAKG